MAPFSKASTNGGSKCVMAYSYRKGPAPPTWPQLNGAPDPTDIQPLKDLKVRNTETGKQVAVHGIVRFCRAGFRTCTMEFKGHGEQAMLDHW